ncbi:HAD family acid phosphatase, partial [Streptomyces sp. NPDC000851]
MTRRRPWASRTAATAVAAAALVAIAAPAEAATSTGTTTTATATTAAAADVDYDTWQKDCQAVMDQALPYLKQRIAQSKPGEKQAIVFDIDNTTLETDFGFSYPQPANQPVLEVAEYAQEHGVDLFCVTRPPRSA